MSEQRSAVSPDEVRRFIRQHFEDFINRKDAAGAVGRNVHPDYVDHLPDGRTVTLKDATQTSDGMFEKYPDVTVDVRDVLVDGDKVVVRNVWTATEKDSGKRVEFHGFVLFRLAEGKLIERWATLTPPRELSTERFDW